MGGWVKGDLNKFHYRLSIGKPFLYDGSKSVLEDSVINFAQEYPSERYALNGYFTYSFLHNEESWFPFYSMTKLGARKVVKVGAGFHYHPNSIAFLDEEYDFKTQGRLQLGLDFFMDYPLANNGLINLYAVAYRYEMGPNYLRSTTGIDGHGINESLNPAYPQGGGLSHYFVGTGNIFYTQAGYLFPFVLGAYGRIMPFATCTVKDLEALNGVLMSYDIGFTYFVYDSNFKITTQYLTRPIYKGTIGEQAVGEQEDLQGMLLMQFHFMF